MFRPESLAALDGLDGVLASLARVARHAPRRYRIVVLSDHGQSQGDTFAQRHGGTLAEVCRELAASPVSAVDDAVEGWGRAESLLDDLAGNDGVGARAADTMARRVRRRVRPMPHRPSAANGHLVQSATCTVWVAGDTSLYPQLAALPTLAGAPIGVAVVPVGGWAPRLSGAHLGPEEAARACAMTGARWAVPVHWGTLHLPGAGNVPAGWMTRAGPDFVEAVRCLAPDCRPVLLPTGGRWTLP